MSEVQAPYTRTFTSFSGADVVAIIDGKVVGEIQSIEWEKSLEYFDAREVTGTITTTMFEEEAMAKFEGKRFDILLRYLNEYGQAKIEFIKGARLTKKAGGVSIDDIVQEMTYSFKADDVVVIGDMLKTTKEQMNFVFENYGTREDNVRLKVDAYMALMAYMFEHRFFEVVNSGELARLRKVEADLQK